MQIGKVAVHNEMENGGISRFAPDSYKNKKMCNKSINVQDGGISTFQKMEKEIEPFWIDEK